METDDEKKKEIIPASGNKFLFDFEQYLWEKKTNPIKCDLMNNARNKIEYERQIIEKYTKEKEVIEQEKLRQTHLLNLLLKTKAEVMKKLKLIPDT